MRFRDFKDPDVNTKKSSPEMVLIDQLLCANIDQVLIKFFPSGGLKLKVFFLDGRQQTVEIDISGVVLKGDVRDE